MKNVLPLNMSNSSMEEIKDLVAFLLEENDSELLSDEQERTLVRQIQAGNDDALAELLKANMRFVVSVSKLYKNNGLEMQDIIAAGTQGLVLAAQKYDESKGARFINYAIWWIRAKIIEAIINK